MTIAETANSHADARDEPEVLSPRWLRQSSLYALIGFALVVTNFPKFLTRLVDANVASVGWRTILHAPIQAMQIVLAILVGPHPSEFFQRAMTCSFFLLWLFFALLAILSIHRHSLRMFACGIVGTVLGYFALHLLAWVAVAVVLTVKGTIFVVRWVGAVISAILSFVFHYTWPLLLVTLAFALLYAAYLWRGDLLVALRWLGRSVRKYAMRLAGGALFIALLVVILPALYDWVVKPILAFLSWLFTPIVQAILFLAKWVFGIVFVVLFLAIIVTILLASLAFVGSLLVTQLQAGWHAARSLRCVLIAGFAIGSAFALIVLVSMATPAVADSLNQAWLNVFIFAHVADIQTTTHFVTDAFRLFLPQSVESFAFAHLTNLQAPALDGFIFMIVMALASLSIIFRLFSVGPPVNEVLPLKFVVEEYAKIILGMFVILILIFVAAFVGESRS
ncbi:MAG TPA: hypothetical protein VIM02_01825 [Rhizomicrobium sp.]